MKTLKQTILLYMITIISSFCNDYWKLLSNNTNLEEKNVINKNPYLLIINILIIYINTYNRNYYQSKSAIENILIFLDKFTLLAYR